MELTWRGTDPPPDRNAVRTSADVNFGALCKMLQFMKDGNAFIGGGKQAKKTSNTRKDLLNIFRTRFLPEKPSAELLFEVYRLLMPKMDKERQVYKLKEQSLAEVIALSLGIHKQNEAHAQLMGWRKVQGGIFADTVQQVVGSLKLSVVEPPTTVKEVNDMLNELAGVMQRDSAVKQRDFQAKIMRPLLLRMNRVEISWLCRIILKSEMKIGMQEKGLLDDLHVDANTVFNTCCDLRKTFEVVAPCLPNERVKRQDVIPGQMIRMQTSQRIQSQNKLLSTLRSKDYIAELKLDGERFQLHRVGDKVFYYSRSMVEHGERGYDVLDTVVKQQVASPTVILDGELVIWHTGLKQFVKFGNNKTVINKVRDAWIAKRGGAAVAEHEEEGKEADSVSSEELSQLQVWYMAFDILYLDDHSVIDRTLHERHKILQSAVAPPPNGQSAILISPPGEEPVFGVIKLLLPGSPWSQPVRANDPTHLQQLMQEAIDKGEEGVVFKDLESQWQKADSSSAWIKFKPDYLQTEDLDVLIIGAFNGTGWRGGKLSMFLLAVAEKPHGGGDPCVFHSFCRVGTGLNMENLEFLQKHFEGRLLPGGRGKQPPCYKVTGSDIETPDYWVKDPRESIVLTIKGDMRTIQTTTFYSKNTLRFPRVMAVRKDKRWSDICTDAQLQDEMWNSGRLTAGIKGDGSGGGGTRGTGRQGAGGQQRAAAPKRGVRTVAPGLAAASTEDIEQESALFANEYILVLAPCDIDAVCKFIAKHGGNWVRSWGDQVTRVVTNVFSPGLATKADVAAGVTRYPGQECVNPLMDVLHISWLHDCVDAGRLLPPAPRHRLRYVAKSEANLERDLDRYGDSFVDPVTAEDMVALLTQVSGAAKHAAARAEAFAAHLKKSSKAKAPDSRSLEAAIVEEVRAELQATDVAQMLAAERELSDTPFSCMRSFHVTLLPLPPRRTSRFARQADSIAAAADDAVRPYAYQRLVRSIQLFCGVVSEELSEATTHLVALPHEGWASVTPGAVLLRHPPPTRADVEAALEARSPAQAALMRRRVCPVDSSRESSALQGHLWIVSREWLDNRLECAAAGAAPRKAGAAAPQLRFMHDFVLPEGPAPHGVKRPADGDSPRRVMPRIDAH